MGRTRVGACLNIFVSSNLNDLQLPDGHGEVLDGVFCLFFRFKLLYFIL